MLYFTENLVKARQNSKNKREFIENFTTIVSKAFKVIEIRGKSLFKPHRDELEEQLLQAGRKVKEIKDKIKDFKDKQTRKLINETLGVLSEVYRSYETYKTKEPEPERGGETDKTKEPEPERPRGINLQRDGLGIVNGFDYGTPESKSDVLQDESKSDVLQYESKSDVLQDMGGNFSTQAEAKGSDMVTTDAPDTPPKEYQVLLDQQRLSSAYLNPRNCPAARFPIGRCGGEPGRKAAVRALHPDHNRSCQPLATNLFTLEERLCTGKTETGSDCYAAMRVGIPDPDCEREKPFITPELLTAAQSDPRRDLETLA